MTCRSPGRSWRGPFLARRGLRRGSSCAPRSFRNQGLELGNYQANEPLRRLAAPPVLDAQRIRNVVGEVIHLARRFGGDGGEDCALRFGAAGIRRALAGREGGDAEPPTVAGP